MHPKREKLSSVQSSSPSLAPFPPPFPFSFAAAVSSVRTNLTCKTQGFSAELKKRTVRRGGRGLFRKLAGKMKCLRAFPGWKREVEGGGGKIFYGHDCVVQSSVHF